MARHGRSMTQRVAAAILIGAAAIGVVRAAMPAHAPSPIALPRQPAAPAVPSKPRPAPVAAVPHLIAAAPAAMKPGPAASPQAIHRIIDTGGPIRYGTWFWDDSRASGPITVAVDLKASVLSVFRGGDEIGTTAVIYGADDRETPLGTFPILQKDRHHFSNRYHHAPMPYMLRLTGDGVSIHASDVAADYATHGCIGVPAGFARKLFEAASVGDRVIVTNRGMRAA